ncbi:MAG: hypothetical protein IT221_16110, partial [Fluviicola sp.]|nr:hypothetical protein [Fluviicola sp.]
TYLENDSLAINYKLLEVNDPSMGIHHARIIFQYINKTSNELTVSFGRVITYNDSEAAKPQEKNYTVTIPANGAVSYDETTKNDKKCYVFAQDKKHTIKKTLVNFEIVNLKVN